MKSLEKIQKEQNMFFDKIKHQLIGKHVIFQYVEQKTKLSKDELIMLKADFEDYLYHAKNREQNDRLENEKLKRKYPRWEGDEEYDEDGRPITHVHPSHYRKDLDFFGCDRFLKLLDNLISGNKPPDKSDDMFHDFLKHDKKEKLAELIRDEFRGKKGKNIALLISDLTHRDPPLLKIESRENESFYRAMRKFFGCSIGRSQGINFYLKIPTNQFINQDLEDEIQAVKTQIDSILKAL